MVSRRHAKANNPGMGEGNWIADKLKTYLLYLDANNLYGWAMMQYLPTGGFRWVRDEYSLNKLKNLVNNGLIKDDADEGYILRVKLRYPENLHTSHTDYPLAVERMKVKKEWLSPKQQELIQRSGQRYVLTEKLIPNLFDKDEYVVHYRNLPRYLPVI